MNNNTPINTNNTNNNRNNTVSPNKKNQNNSLLSTFIIPKNNDNGRFLFGKSLSLLKKNNDNNSSIRKVTSQSRRYDVNTRKNQVKVVNINLTQIDGNNNKIWETNTEGKGIGPYSIYISEEGNFVLVDSKNYPVWDKDNKFSNYENVIFQDVKVLSNNGKNYAILSNDSSFIAYEDVKKKYDLTCEQIFEREDSDDRGVPPYYAVVQNGYFKVIDSRNDILYQSSYFGNYCKPGSIQISNECSITVVDCNGKIVWKRF